jgi:hypothetical protein
MRVHLREHRLVQGEMVRLHLFQIPIERRDTIRDVEQTADAEGVGGAVRGNGIAEVAGAPGARDYDVVPSPGNRISGGERHLR